MAAHILRYAVNQWITIIMGIHATLCKIFCFKWKYDKEFIHIFSDLANTSRTPGPQFGSNIVKDLYGVLFGKLSNLQVKAGVVNQYDHIRLILKNILLTEPKIITYLINIPDNISYTHYGTALIVTD